MKKDEFFFCFRDADSESKYLAANQIKKLEFSVNKEKMINGTDITGMAVADSGYKVFCKNEKIAETVKDSYITRLMQSGVRS